MIALQRVHGSVAVRQPFVGNATGAILALYAGQSP
jgi:hypothetical protein